MKRLLRLSLLALALIGVMLLVAGPVAAKPPGPEFTGCESDLGIEPGEEWTFPGGRMHLRGRIHYFHDETTDPRATGVDTVRANGNFNAEFIGTAWGTFTLVPDDPKYDGGYWEGSWIGPDNRPEISVVGHGRGKFKGLELRETLVWGPVAEGNCPGIVDPGYIEGYILELHGE